MRAATAILCVLLPLGLPAVAQGQNLLTPKPAATTPAPAPPPAAAPAPAPVAGVLAIRAERVGRGRTVLAGARWRVRGSLTPYVPGQQVSVRFLRGSRKLGVKRVTLLPSTRNTGAFVVGFRTTRPGPVVVRASHPATPELATAVARPTSVDVLPLRVRAGAKGLAVRMLQQRLARLGYVVGRRGRFDARTGRAVLAFRKVTGMARTSAADRAVFSRLARGRGAFRVRFPRHGRHVEADISRQVVALIGAGGKVERILPTSSGAPSTPTILGSFRIYRKDFGTNALGMVHAAYFIRGYALHGFRSVPTYGASHGCLRVPIPDALSLFRWVRHGTPVDTYR